MIGALPALRLRDLLLLARARNASDLHLDSGASPAIRVDGVLEALHERALDAGELDEISASVLSVQERESLRRQGDVSVTWTDEELGRVRAHFYRGAGGLAIAIRLLLAQVPTLEQLGVTGAIESLAERRHGLVVFAGPTGSGKSTTLAAFVDRINARSARRIVTIEDPIEYCHVNRRSVLTQRQIGRDTRSLADALHGVLRADPDVIAVGEIRDADAIRAALTVAETGHLVLTTLHTADAAQTIERIVDAFSGDLAQQVRVQLAQVLVGVVCQHLVRRANGAGRIAVVEILLGTDAVRNLIRESKSHQIRNAMGTGKQFGMQTLEQHARELVARGEIDATSAGFLLHRSVTALD